MAISVMPQAAPGLVWGQVRSQSTGAPLPYAVVELVSPAHLHLSAQTDSNGIYVLRDVPPGRRLLRASHIDHAPLEVEVLVLAGQQVSLDFDLELRPVRLPMVTARAPFQPGLRDTLRAPVAELTAATVHAMEATPGVAELGLAQAVREVPGHEPPDPSDVLYVRGGAADLKLVLLNGAPVYSPFHIGGLISALDGDLIRSATLYLGGAPARYDGGLSYVMDLESRSGRTKAAHASASMDMLAAKGMAEGPLGHRLAYLVGGRGVHGLGAAPFVSAPFPYIYGDALGRVDVAMGADASLSITGFWNREAVRLDSLGPMDDAASWGNAAGSVRYRGRLAGSDALLTMAVGTFRTRLPLGGIRPLVTDGYARRVRLAADFDRTMGPVRLHYGGSYDRNRFEYRAWPQGSAPEPALLRADGSGDVTGVYVEAAVNASERVRLRGGVRTDLFSLDPTPRIAPRVSATLALTQRASLTIAAGSYRQYVRAPDESLVFVGTAVADSVVSAPLTVASASHLVLELDQELGEGLNMGIEGFYKVFDGLPASTGQSAQSSGLDLWVRRGAGRFTGWFGYSLAWVWSANDPWSPSRLFAGRHLVSAGMSGPIVGRGQFDVRVAYGAGLPYTAIPEPEAATPVFAVAYEPRSAGSVAEPVPSVPAEPDQPYLRLDAQLGRTFSADWGGRAFDVTPYVKVLNALDRRDALFYRYDRNQSGHPHPLSAIPVLPLVGVECKF